MTRKHFEALAAALKEHGQTALGDSATAHDPQALFADLTWSIADTCARFNPNFDRTRFLKACGVEESK